MRRSELSRSSRAARRTLLFMFVLLHLGFDQMSASVYDIETFVFFLKKGRRIYVLC